MFPDGLIVNPLADSVDVACASVWPITLGTGDDDAGVDEAVDADAGVVPDAAAAAGCWAAVIAGDALDDDAGTPPGYAPCPPVIAPWSRRD